VAGYASLRRFAQAGVVLDKWDDLRQVLPEPVVADLRALYTDVDDVDPMFALLEEPETDAIVGKSFLFIMLDQFARLRTGNRFYWEHADALFTDEQRAQLHRASPAALLCSNLPLTTVPQNPLYPASDKNPEVNCADVERMDMTAWTPIKQVVQVPEDEDQHPPQPVAQEEVPSEEVEAEVEDEESVASEDQEEEEGEVVVEVVEEPREIVETVTIVEVVEVPAEETGTVVVPAESSVTQTTGDLPTPRSTEGVNQDAGPIESTAKLEL